MEVEAGGLISNEGGVSKWRVNTLVEQLRYDVKDMTVKAGQKMHIEFNNPDALPHNLVITNPGTATDVANAAIAMGADGFAAQFIPESSDIIAHTDMIDGQTSTELEFDVPSEPGDYEFVCTFPGHTINHAWHPEGHQVIAFEGICWLWSADAIWCESGLTTAWQSVQDSP